MPKLGGCFVTISHAIVCIVQENHVKISVNLANP